MKKYVGLFKNKYAVTFTLFVLYNFFLNSIDIPFILSSRWDFHKLNDRVTQLRKDNERVKFELDAINNQTFALEKLAREEYFMKKSNEDVYVFKIKN